jgi:hypothetical protein
MLQNLKWEKPWAKLRMTRRQYGQRGLGRIAVCFGHDGRKLFWPSLTTPGMPFTARPSA